jgi:hypothetical protein
MTLKDLNRAFPDTLLVCSVINFSKFDQYFNVLRILELIDICVLLLLSYFHAELYCMFVISEFHSTNFHLFAFCPFQLL